MKDLWNVFNNLGEYLFILIVLIQSIEDGLSVVFLNDCLEFGLHYRHQLTID